MQNLEKRLDNIEKNVIRGNLIALTGTVAFLQSQVTDETEKKLLKLSSFLLAVAVALNGTMDISKIWSEHVRADCEGNIS
jgi:hypothetical protein